MPAMPSAESHYREQIERYAADQSRETVWDRALSLARLAYFLAATVTLIAAGDAWGIGWYGALLAAITVFLGLVAYHESVRDRLERARRLRRINEQHVARIERRWPGIPQTNVEVPAAFQAISDDLDLFGDVSLFHLICVASSPRGIQTVRDWFLRPATPKVIQDRQQAVAALTPHDALREALILEGQQLADQGRAADRFQEWATSPPWLTRRPWLIGLCWTVPGAGLVCLVLTLTRRLPPNVGGAVILAVLAINLVITACFGGKVHDLFRQVTSSSRGEVKRYRRLFALFGQLPDRPAPLTGLRHCVQQVGGGAELRLRSLDRIVVLANISHSALFAILVYLPLQALVLIDFQMLIILEGWQRRYGHLADGWFRALAELEALVSLSLLQRNQPAWSLPQVVDSADRIEGLRIGHPLLSDRVRVPNDATVGPAGRILLVTGSNMSGKSTLLRSLGLNVVLAQAGAPVCAESWTQPPLEIATSVRTRDSLAEGVSFFMAELLRLKEIVDLARDEAARGGRRLLFLLDEILLGTNSRERHLAVERVLASLIHCQAIGAVTTHDLELATSESLTEAVDPVHFREILHDPGEGPRMTFDYKLRPGIATTTNALELLRQVGL